ncbi:MAG TPA: C40 family peptidase [Rhizomicrobium sp.]|jgi:cell wall-associated NlpC family hydrolase
MNDPRTTPARPDLAAGFLEGKVEAARFVDGVEKIVRQGHVPLHVEPSVAAMRDTELLYGERFTVYETKGDWCWGQSARDGYVGYARADAFADMGEPADHRITALSTPLLRQPSLKTSPFDMLPLNARVKAIGREAKCLQIAGGGFVYEKHLAPLSYKAADWVAIAERFLGVPYVWGGRTLAGLDCSGLTQSALEAGGIEVPRDSDQQEAALTANTIATPEDLSGMRRGDIVFWNEHVGVMLDDTRLLHANGFYGEVAVEPFRVAVERIKSAGNAITSIKRL